MVLLWLSMVFQWFSMDFLERTGWCFHLLVFSTSFEKDDPS